MRRARPDPIVAPRIAPAMRMRRSTESALEYRRASAGCPIAFRTCPIWL